jgi:hypothetical protein
MIYSSPHIPRENDPVTDRERRDNHAKLRRYYPRRRRRRRFQWLRGRK